jgi:hypothetical protein
MKTFRLLMVLLFVAFVTAPVWAQYTLYGSPQVMRLPDSQAAGYAQTASPNVPTGPMMAPTAGAYGSAVPVRPTMLDPASAPRPISDPGQPMPPQQTYQQPMVQQPNVVSSVLAESDMQARAACGAESCAPAPSCGPITCEPACCCPWFGGVSWITLGRDKANRVWTSYNSDDLRDQLTNTGDIEMDWGNGGEIRFGRRFCGCDCVSWGLEVIYWTMQPVEGSVSTEVTTGNRHVSSPLDFDYTRFDNPDPLLPPISGGQYFDNAAKQQLWRRNEFHNVELNLVRGSFTVSCMPSWNVQWLVGVRFFRFDEDLRYGSVERNYDWGDLAHEAFLDDRIKNNLIGFQFGFDARSNCWCNLQLYLAPKIGIYNNYIENQYSLYRGDGTNAYAVDQFDATVGNYPIHATDNVFSVLTEIDLGVYWHITQNWSAKVGYRLMAATNMGLADNQYIHYVNDVPEIAHIKTNGDLLLHGAEVGITYNY